MRAVIATFVLSQSAPPASAARASTRESDEKENVGLAALAMLRRIARVGQSREIPRCALMLGHQRREVEPDRLPVDDPPFACDHHPVGAMRPAQNQRRERIMRAREARLVELDKARSAS
jgi:hypothetical protein